MQQRLATFLLLGAIGCTSQAHEDAAAPPPVSVETAAVVAADVPRSLPAVGTLESPRSADLAPEIRGTLIALDVPEGKEVPQGYVLARLDDQRARASLSVNQARSRNAEATLGRWRELADARIAAPQNLDDAVAERRATAGQAAEAQVTLDKTVVRAPFRGVVGLKQVSEGAFLEAGTPIVRLTQIDPLELRFAIPQRHADAIAVGQRARGVVGSCESPFAAEVTAIEPDLDPATRMLRVQARVPNPDGRLRPGMAARVRLETGIVSGALLVPLEAVVRQGTRTLVWVVRADGTAEARDVALGQTAVDRVQVASGLAAGDTVVTAGHQKLRPGARVTAVPGREVTNPKLALGSRPDDPTCEF